MVEKVDITKMSVQELKALAYDIVLQLNQAQANLTLVQAEIKKREEKTDGE